MAFAFKKAGLVLGFLSFAVMAFAVSIVIVIAKQLWPSGEFTVCNSFTGLCETVFLGETCLMSDKSVNICAYGYATAAIGVIACVFTLFAACLPAMVSLLLSLFGSVWWLAYSITATVYNNDLPGGYPRGYYRNVVIALSWTTFACCVLSVVLAIKMRGNEKKKDARDKPQFQEAPAVV